MDVTTLNTSEAAASAPVSVSRIGLRARNANAVADFYKSVLGLRESRRSGNTISLAAGDRDLLEIEGSGALKPDNPRSAGLFHTAFLLPGRADLARWARFAIDRKIPIDGASDHLVSEAIYLTDPEGNGVEIYADRPRDAWKFNDNAVRMTTERLNFESLLGEPDSGGGWSGAPQGSMIGHVHLRAGDVAAAENWWRREMHFDTMAHYGDRAVFLSTGGYHHHIGANSWQSLGAGSRPFDTTGLAFVELASKNADRESSAADPWGTEIRTVPA